jgi:23S rRNA (uracil1939-C5)-methyltransferase
MQAEVRIARLGAQGTEGAEGPLFVPFTLPGELARIEIEPDGKHASLLELLEPSPERVTPICSHFGICGGCALQHLEQGAYLRWKREQVVAALKSRGLDLPVEPVRSVPLGSRRRASLALGRDPAGLAFGYRRLRSHELVDVKAYPVLSPSIVARLPGLKAALAQLLSGKRRPKPITASMWSFLAPAHRAAP